MNELLLQYIWQHQLFNKQGLTTVQGHTLEILDRGVFNTNQGPDFLNGRVRLQNTTWAGHIEIHVKGSDWNRHEHSIDRNYDNVILHVVWDDDVLISREMPTLMIEDKVSTVVLERYRGMMHRNLFIPCENLFSQATTEDIDRMINRMMHRRLERKADHVLQLLNGNGRHWEEVLWWMTARSFGGNINGDAFESIARSIPYQVVARHRSQIHQLESLLLGQADLLSSSMEDQYAIMLQKEYQFLFRKYQFSLNRIPVHFLRMRPQNFPTVRLAQLAMLMHMNPHLFAIILQEESLKAISKLFEVTANDYWHYHYRLNEATPLCMKSTGTAFVHSIIVNAVVPVLYCYSRGQHDAAMMERARSWLHELPAERNAITSRFGQLGISIDNAYKSQGVLELKHAYCDQKLCLQCSIGKKLLAFN
jgi:hypothetical protein